MIQNYIKIWVLPDDPPGVLEESCGLLVLPQTGLLHPKLGKHGTIL